MAGVLEGIRVLDFGRYIAGPYCAAMLAEHGAEVIRIEKREGSEDRFQAPVAETGEGALFLQINRNKLGLTLDPMVPEGQEIVRKLVATADVVIANLPLQTIHAMKLDYESLKAVKPDIILTTVSAYGNGGPYSDRVGFDGIGQVMSGAVYMTGTEDQPYRAQVPWVDFGTALHCAFGTMAALMARKVTGKGQWVQGALLATAVTFGNALLIEQAVIETNRVPTGNRGQTAAPVDIFRTRDGWILVPGDRPPALQALGQIDGRGALAHRSALQGRHLARRQRRHRQRAHGPLVRGSHHGRCVRDPGRGEDFRLAQCSSRSRPSMTRTSRPWASSRTPSSPARRGRHRSPRCRCGCRRRRARSGIVRPRSARTPTRSWASSATAPKAIAALREKRIV